MDETLDLGLDCALKHDMRTLDVSLGELERVSETEINMRLCREVEDGVNLVFSQCSEDVVAVGDVAKEKVEVLAS